jgi:hypothetical protein
MRFNFFAYMLGTTEGISMSLQVQSGSQASASDTRNGFDLNLLDVVSIRRLAAFTSTGSTDPLAVTLREIRKVNNETKAAVVDETGTGVLRELRLYICAPTPDFGVVDPTTLAQELASVLQMKVFALSVPVVFRPHLQTDPLDEIRGRVSLSDDGPIFLDVHRLDPEMQGF